MLSFFRKYDYLLDSFKKKPDIDEYTYIAENVLSLRD